ncbi:MAG: tetratricopeptide repeat protein [Bacteroidia bacterium]
MKNCRHMQKLLLYFVAGTFTFIACGPKDLINKTKYGNKKFVNTCRTFQKEVQSLIDANSGVSELRVSEYDNSQFDPLFLEPGQFMQHENTLYFRLINDLEYGKYLQKDVAIIVKARFDAVENLKAMEKSPEGIVGELIIDEAYYKANKDPFFVYKIPMQEPVDGKQVSLSFSVVKIKQGKIQKVFCNSVEAPLGPLTPSCCTALPWANSRTYPKAAIPELNIPDEKYRYEGFTGTLDLIFPMNSTKFNKKELADAILQYLGKYEEMGYLTQSIRIEGYASQGGTVEYNLNLSQRRSDAVTADLKDHFEKKLNRPLPIEAIGKGEDWERFVLLVKTADFTDEERSQLLEIANMSISEDEKEALLRKLPFWQKLIEKVLVYCRHTLVSFEFTYQPDRMYVERYNASIPLAAPELYNVATKTFIISRFRPGVDARKNLGILNTLIDVRKNETPNLFAMRSTYHFALNELEAAIRDVEKAYVLRKDPVYQLAALAYKTQNADDYPMEERMRMLENYNDLIQQNPSDASLRLNRAILMDRIGWLSGAIAENSQLLAEDQRFAAAFNNRGVSRMRALRLLEAEADFQEAINLDPNLAEAHFNLSVLYAYKGLPDKAAAAFDKAIALRPELKKELFANQAFKIVKDNPKFAKYY